MNMDPLSGFL